MISVAKTKEKKDKQGGEAPEEQAQSPAPSSEQPQEEQAQPPDPPKQSNLLLNLLTILLVVLGIGEAALLGYVGFQAFLGIQARDRYLAQQPGTQVDEPQQLSGASYLGPRLQIENGVVVWRSEDNPLGGTGGGTSPTQTAGTGEGETTRLANMSVPLIGYRLAQEDEEQPI